MMLHITRVKSQCCGRLGAVIRSQQSICNSIPDFSSRWGLFFFVGKQDSGCVLLGKSVGGYYDVQPGWRSRRVQADTPLQIESSFASQNASATLA